MSRLHWPCGCRDGFLSSLSAALALWLLSWGPGSHSVVLSGSSGHRPVHLVLGELLGSQGDVNVGFK